LTGSPRYVVGWCPDSPQQAYKLAARMAARVCVEDFRPYNYDGEPLKTDDLVPLFLPHQNSRPGQDDANAALGTCATARRTTRPTIGCGAGARFARSASIASV
jgi:hypothetical protein